MVRMKDAHKLLRCSIVNVHKMIKRGELPEPMRPHRNFTYWKKEEFNAAVRKMQQKRPKRGYQLA